MQYYAAPTPLSLSQAGFLRIVGCLNPATVNFSTPLSEKGSCLLFLVLYTSHCLSSILGLTPSCKLGSVRWEAGERRNRYLLRGMRHCKDGRAHRPGRSLSARLFSPLPRAWT